MPSNYRDITRYNEEQLGRDTASRKTQISMYSDSTHFIYEILQNADDYKAKEVFFKLSETELWIEHDGEPFAKKNVKAITYFGQSTSREDLVKTGHFGVGFKSVFAFTATPIIISGDEHFQIYGLYRVKDHPYPDDFPSSRTRIILPFNHESEKPDYVEDLMSREDAYSKIKERLTSLNKNTLLFTRNIREIRWETNDDSGHYSREDDKSNNTRMTTITDGEHVKKYLVFSRKPRWNDEVHKTVDVAFGMDEKGAIVPVPAEEDFLYVLFATKQETHLRFILNGPYRTNPARETIPEDDSFNRHLIEETCDLVESMLLQIRKKGLLTTKFLAVLPNRKDRLGDFYKPILNRLVDLFKKEKLTPMKRGGHAAASGIYQYRGNRQLSALINDKDLATILGKDPSLPLWVANAPQRHQESDNFLSSLGIPEWDEEKLVSELSVQSDLIQIWLKDKSDKWHQEFYALLGDFLSNTPYLYKNRKDTLSALPIVRLSDGTYKKGEDCYFPSDAVEHDKIFPRVAKGVYSSGKNKNQQEKARKFLGDDIGVSEVKESDRVKAILDQRYVKGTINLRKRHHEKDLKRFIKLVEDEPSQANLFKDYFIFELDNKNWGMPCARVFVDHPYLDTGLSAYYEALGRNSDRKRALHPKYKKYGIEPRRIGGFAEAVGAHIKLEPQHQLIPKSHPEYKYLISAPGERRGSERNIDYTIPEFKVLLNRLCIGKARLIWRTMNSLSACHLEARYQKTERWGSRDGKSSLVHDLMKAAWMPQKNGDSFRFVRPCDASVDLLPEEFPYENGKKWLETVKFGENAKKASEEYKKREVLLSSLPIDKEIVDYASGLSPEEQKEMMEDHKRKKARYSDQSTQQGNIPFHKALSDSFVASSKDAIEDNVGLGYGGSVKNSSRRRDKTSKSIAADIKKEGEQEIRSYFSAVKKWKGKNDQVRVNLIEWYGGQCQICGKTFTQSNGEPYFEGLYLVSYTTAGWVDRVGNVLCLCPWHSAMFRFGPKEVDEDIIQQILQLKVRAEGGDGQLAIKLRLCGENVEIKFEESHLIDLQEMVKQSQELERPSVG